MKQTDLVVENLYALDLGQLEAINEQEIKLKLLKEERVAWIEILEAHESLP